MLKTESRRRVAFTSAVIVAFLVALPAPSQAFKWGKGGDRARVELPSITKDGVQFADSEFTEPSRSGAKNISDELKSDMPELRQPKDAKQNIAEIRSALSELRNPGSSTPPPPPPSEPSTASPSSSSAPNVEPAPTHKTAPSTKKKELTKRQEELQSAQKDYDRKKYKKSLEKSCQLISEIREFGYLKGEDADQFRALMNKALDLAQRSGERCEKPTVPAGSSGKSLYFVF